MDFILAHYMQLSIVVVAGVGFLLLAYAAPEQIIMKGLILFIPFQLIQSQFATLNTVFVYLVALAFLMRGKITRLPLSGVVAFIIIAYLLSFTQALKATRFDHILYLVTVFSNFLLFYLVYNFTLRINDWRYAWNIIITLNILVILYSILQLIVGFGNLSIFGIEELSLQKNNEGGSRLVGPFRAIAMTAEYFDIQIMIIGYALLNEKAKRRRLLLIIMLAMNSAILVGTGNRGGLVSLVAGGVAFLFLYRGQIGTLRALKIGVVFTLIFVAASVIMVKYSKFNVLYERVQDTEFEGAMPVFREGWEYMWPRVFEKPVFGHGPRLKLRNQEDRRIPGYIPMPFPHNAYMYIFFTLGAVGFLAYAIFLFRLVLRYYFADRIKSDDIYLNGLPRMGIIIIIISLVSEIRMEMFRYEVADFQQYMFMLLAMMLAFSDILRGKGLQSKRTAEMSLDKYRSDRTPSGSKFL